MTPKTSVIVRADRDLSWLTRLVTSLDAQSLPASQFEVLFLVTDTLETDRLDELARRRPNVRIRTVTTGEEAAAALEEAAGEWLMWLDQDLLDRAPRFAPEGLERLIGFAASAQCDLALGRVEFADSVALMDVFLEDAAREDLPPAALVGPALLVQRREFVAKHGLIVDADSAARALDATDRVGVLGAYGCLHVAGSPLAPRASAPRVTDVEASWQDGQIVFRVGGASSRGPGGARVGIAIRQARSATRYWLPVEGGVDDSGSFSVTARLDPRTAALGAPLPNGVWRVSVGVHGYGAEWSGHAAVPPVDLPAGLVDGTLVAGGTADDGSQGVDVGPTRFAAIPRFPASAATIHEDARGTLLTVSLPGFAVAGAARVAGQVLVGGFPLRATLVAEAGAARIECYLSGLCGTAPLATKFGPGKAQPTGLSLTISPTGTMSLSETPSGAPSRPAAGTGAGARPKVGAAAAGGGSLVERLRAHVPQFAEPAARTLAGNPRARQLYRRLAGRS